MDQKVSEFDPGARGRPPLQKRDVTLPDSGLTLKLIWRKNDLLAASAAAEEAALLVTAHITGDGTDPPHTLEIGGEPVEDLPEKLVGDICLIRRMQPKGERCSFVWWLGLALCYVEDYAAVYSAAMELHGEIDPKNLPTAEKPGTSG